MIQNKLEELRNRVASVSVNSLRRVYPDEIQSWLNLSDKEGAQFIGELVKRNLCHIKYDFTCSCGNECTFYQRKGPISPYECSECGQKYDDNVIQSKGTMTLELKKQEIENSVPQVANTVPIFKVVEGERNMEKQKVFIVHGHDSKLKFEVSSWLWSLDLEPIILHEQASGGTRSIIDKIGKYSNVAAAIVLLTADDEGKSKEEADYKPRARQNVVFEAGYFIAKLNPDRVILLYEADVEIPGDLGGCIYISTSKQWKDDIRKEFNAMQIPYKK